MTHPEHALPLRYRKGYRGPVVATPAPRSLPAERLAELDALAALFAEVNGDTPETTAERRRTPDIEALAFSDAHAWDRAIRNGLRELPAPATTDTDRRGA